MGLGVFRVTSATAAPGLIVWLLILVPSIYMAVRVTEVLSPGRPEHGRLHDPAQPRAGRWNSGWSRRRRWWPHTMQRPLFGWGTFQGTPRLGERGSIVDSFWIIHFARYGMIGLAALYATYALAQMRAAQPPSDVRLVRPALRPGRRPDPLPVGLAVRRLLNAYQAIPAVPMSLGLLVALPASRGGRIGQSWFEAPTDEPLERVDRLVAVGRPAEAEAACQALVAGRSADPGRPRPAGRRVRPAGRPAGGHRPARRGRAASPPAPWSCGPLCWPGLPEEPTARLAMAGCCERLARGLSPPAGRGPRPSRPAIRALELRAAVLADDPDDPTAGSPTPTA